MRTGRPPTHHPEQPPNWRPLCACGCGEPVLRRCHKYLDGHAPPKHGIAEAVQGRKRWIYRCRAKFFRAELQRLTARGRRITTEDLLATLHRVYERGYDNGVQKEMKRLMRKIRALEAERTVAA